MIYFVLTKHIIFWAMVWKKLLFGTDFDYVNDTDGENNEDNDNGSEFNENFIDEFVDKTLFFTTTPKESTLKKKQKNKLIKEHNRNINNWANVQTIAWLVASISRQHRF